MRRFPTSKKFPWFNKENLKESLEREGIGYVHIEKLGGYREGGYVAYTKTKEYKEGLKELIKIAKKAPTVILCSEWKWWKCHRKYIANDLVKMGIKVIHILTKERIQEHKIGDKEIEERMKSKVKCDKKIRKKL